MIEFWFFTTKVLNYVKNSKVIRIEWISMENLIRIQSFFLDWMCVDRLKIIKSFCLFKRKKFNNTKKNINGSLHRSFFHLFHSDIVDCVHASLFFYSFLFLKKIISHRWFVFCVMCVGIFTCACIVCLILWMSQYTVQLLFFTNSNSKTIIDFYRTFSHSA